MDRHKEMRRLEALADEITTLWGEINAATYRFLTLVGKFDRTEGWSHDGLASCAQWLNWQCGIGMAAAREKVRVARALETLPQISAAFRRGQVSYSKVRAMTRVATAAMEPDLLNIALHGTASHVERVVSKFRRVQRIEEATRAQRQHRERSVDYFYDEDGSFVLRAKLPSELGAIVRKALEAAMQRTADANETESNVSAETSVRERTAEYIGLRRADALTQLAEHFLDCDAQRHPSSVDRFQVVVHMSRNGCCDIEDGPALAAETARRFGCDGSIVGLIESDDGEPLSVGRKTRAIPPALRRALKARDGGCRYPGCDHSRFTDGHHVKHWADGGETKLGNLVTLCRFHHRLVHEGGFGVRATDDGLFVFSRPDGERIAVAGEAVRCFRGNVSSVIEQDIEIDAETIRSRWQGEPLDYGLAIEALWRNSALAHDP